MDAVRTGAPSQFRIRGDQQEQAALAADVSQPSCDAGAFRRPEVAIDDSRLAGQPLCGRGGIGRAFRIGEVIERRDRRRARVAIEPARKRG